MIEHGRRCLAMLDRFWLDLSSVFVGMLAFFAPCDPGEYGC
jgi:hypothetical protein